jgi:hypothetical protein
LTSEEKASAHSPKSQVQGTQVRRARCSGIHYSTQVSNTMARQSRPQKKTVGRVMHEYKHGQLKSGGRRKVKDRKQAVAIALREAGASRSQTPAEKRRQLQKTKAKEARGATGRARAEGRGRKTTATRSTSRSGAARRGTATRTSTKRTTQRTSMRGGRSSTRRTGEMTRAELYQEARRRNIPGRSRMSKAQLKRAVGQR